MKQSLETVLLALKTRKPDITRLKRDNLRNIHSSDRPKFSEKYLRNVSCTCKIQKALAVRLEYGDDAEKHKYLVPGNTKNADSATTDVGWGRGLVSLDVNNPDFEAGVTLAPL